MVTHGLGRTNVRHENDVVMDRVTARETPIYEIRYLGEYVFSALSIKEAQASFVTTVRLVERIV